MNKIFLLLNFLWLKFFCEPNFFLTKFFCDLVIVIVIVIVIVMVVIVTVVIVTVVIVTVVIAKVTLRVLKGIQTGLTSYLWDSSDSSDSSDNKDTVLTQKSHATSTQPTFLPTYETVVTVDCLQTVLYCTDKAMFDLHSSNFYTLPSCYPGHAISKTVSWASVALFLPVLVNVQRYSRKFNGKRA